MEIILFDLTNTGHHLSYLDTIKNGLLKNNFIVEIYNKRFYYPKLLQNVFPAKFNKNFVQMISLIECSKYAKSKNFKIINILCADDNLYGTIVAIKIINLINNFTFLLNFHSYQTGLIRGIFIKSLFYNKNNNFLIHGKRLANNYGKIIKFYNRILILDYPVIMRPINISNYDAKFKLQIPENKKVILLFGSWRFEKGYDIAIAALRYIKSDIVLVIAGQATHFTEQDLAKLIIENEIKSEKVLIINKFIPEEEIGKFYAASDIVIIPYRKSFHSQSGLLMDSITFNVDVVAANVNQLGEIVSINGLGLLHCPEDPKDLAVQIDNYFYNQTKYSELFSQNRKKYLSTYSNDRFILSYVNFLKYLFKG